VEPPEPGTGITRRSLELVIRRASELSTAEADADEEISEDEVVRIAAELGLPARAVRQALYETPRAPPAQPTLAEKLYGPETLTNTRAVRGDPAAVSARVEEYLTTREYLQVRRRFRDYTTFSAADDTVSNVFRFFFRSSRRHHLSRSLVGLSVRPLEPGWSHIRLDIDLTERRQRAFGQSIIVGTLTGAALGTGAVVLATSVMVIANIATAFAPLVLLAAGVGGFAAGFAAVVSAYVARFRRWTGGAREEVAALLDRAESGERLAPPPAPWWRQIIARR
jgi:hypothetical protein